MNIIDRLMTACATASTQNESYAVSDSANGM